MRYFVLIRPTANPRISLTPAFLPCLRIVCTQFEIAKDKRTTTFIATTATKNCHMFGFESLPEISETFIP